MAAEDAQRTAGDGAAAPSPAPEAEASVEAVSPDEAPAGVVGAEPAPEPEPLPGVPAEPAPEPSPGVPPEPALEPEPSPGAPAEPTAVEVEQDLDELVARAAQADEYLALAQRTQADFENFRKRAARDARAAEDRGVTRVTRELLPAIDNLGRALAATGVVGNGAAVGAGEEETPEHHLAAGIKLIHDELLAALARVGIEAYSPQGEPFDPQEHEAMAQHPVEGTPSGTVVEVYQSGYRLGGSVLRPARVVVAA